MRGLAMTRLIRKKGRKVWIFRCKVNGKTFERSTGQRNKRLAEREVPRLKRIADLLRDEHESLMLSKAIDREITKAETDISTRQADRIECGLLNFLRWTGDIAVEKITTDLIEDYQRFRLKPRQVGEKTIPAASKDTVAKEVNWVCRMLKRVGHEVSKPKMKPGTVTVQREFTPDELKAFFGACPAQYRNLFLLMLATGARPAELIPSKRSEHVPLLASEIDLETCVVSLRQAKNRRGEAQRHPRAVRVEKTLLEAILAQTEGDHPFWPIPIGLAHLFDRIIADAGIPKVDALGRKVTAHSFRHTWATEQAKSLDAFALRRALGHTQISTTDRYVHSIAPAVVVQVSELMGGTPGGNIVDNSERKAV